MALGIMRTLISGVGEGSEEAITRTMGRQKDLGWKGRPEVSIQYARRHGRFDEHSGNLIGRINQMTDQGAPVLSMGSGGRVTSHHAGGMKLAMPLQDTTEGAAGQLHQFLNKHSSTYRQNVSTAASQRRADLTEQRTSRNFERQMASASSEARHDMDAYKHLSKREKGEMSQFYRAQESVQKAYREGRYPGHRAADVSAMSRAERKSLVEQAAAFEAGGTTGSGTTQSDLFRGSGKFADDTGDTLISQVVQRDGGTKNMTRRSIRKSGMPDDSVDPITSMRNQALDPESGLPIGMVRGQERWSSVTGMRNFDSEDMTGFDPNMVKTHTTDQMTQGTNTVSDVALGRTSMGGSEHVNVSTGRVEVSDKEFRQMNKVKGDEDWMAQSLNRGKESGPVTTSEFDRKLNQSLSHMFDEPKGPNMFQRAGAEIAASGSYLADAAGKHMAGAVVGAGAVTMSEGEVTASGLARGAMFGMGGGIVGRMAAGSLQGGALNQMGKQFGGALGGVSKEGRVGGAANKAGNWISDSMDALSSGASTSTNAMRAATFGGAALAGFSMARDSNHSRGLNSGRGSRF